MICPVSCFSSTSSEVCQKKRYGEIVVPKITTNTVNGTSTTVWDEGVLNDMSELCYWEGGHPKDLFLGPALKRVTSGFTNGDMQYDRKTGRQTSTVREYEGDFETITVHLHRFVNDQADTVFRALLLELEKWAIAYGMKPVEEELAKTGKSTKGHITGELTLEARAENANALAFDMVDVAP